MRILKHSGDYLRRKSETSLSILKVLFLTGVPSTLFLFILNSILAIPVLLIVLFIGIVLSQNYFSYSQGLKGETLVTSVLSSLDDEYLLINDMRFPNGYGNIDHIVLGPNGIFVIETKNYSGQIICFGDKWLRRYARFYRSTDYDLGSPSKQVKKNAMKIKHLIDSIEIFRPLNVWIEGVVVLANKDVDLLIKNPPGPVLKINELLNHIKNRETGHKFTPQELDTIGEAILGHTLK